MEVPVPRAAPEGRASARPRSRLSAGRPAWHVESLHGALDLGDESPCPPEPGLTDLRAKRIGPGPLGLGDDTQHLPPALGGPQELRAAMSGIGLIGREAIGHEQIRDALHGLARDPPPARDLGYRRWPILDGIEDYPAGQRLAADSCQRLPGGGDEAPKPATSTTNSV